MSALLYGTVTVRTTPCSAAAARLELLFVNAQHLLARMRRAEAHARLVAALGEAVVEARESAVALNEAASCVVFRDCTTTKSSAE